jgi:dienelactone hydrolase
MMAAMVTARGLRGWLLAIAALGAAGVLPARALVPAGDAPPAGTLIVRKWLALDAVDDRWRVPFNANTPFLRYLLDRGAPPPKEGERVKGGKAEAAWRPVEAKPDGTLEDENGAWFYGEVEAPKEPAVCVWLAHLDGATALFVNGAGFVGDVYRGGFGPVPVALTAGTNRLIVAGPRGPWRLQLEPWKEGRSPVLQEDATLPDAGEGVATNQLGSLRILNPSTSWGDLPDVDVRAGIDGKPSPPQHTLPLAMLPRGGFAPLWTGKCFVDLSAQLRERPAGPVVEFVALCWSREGAPLGPSVGFQLQARKPGEPRRVTFLSAIDGTIQYYAVLPQAPSDLPPGKIATVLALHGASVDAIGLPGCYAPKPDFRIVAPTNRRPFGFDWQDWGRTDAYEALADALGRFGGDPSRVFLTGHSMGGHGVWHLAANDPGRWAAIAPSSAWCSFDTYGGGPRPETPLTPLWRACDGGSRTEDLIANLVPIPTYILHGTKDDDVPFTEAEGMLDRITKAGGKPLHHFQEGAVHWWDLDPAPGVDCVDWPGIFELFRKAPPRAPKVGPMPAPCTGAPAPGAPVPAGPFRRAFDNRFVLVVGTKGTEEENREMLELARYHAEQWWYRGNGNAPVVRDTDFLSGGREFAKRNLILYGNADTNAAWAKVVPASCPLKARRGALALGDREWKGDSLGAVLVQPRADDADRLVGAFASTGARGTRMGYGLLPFVSGVGYPDYAVFGEEFLRSGDGGVLAAGWFDRRWALQAGGFIRGEGR